MNAPFVVFEDERVLAVCKPAGQPTIPGRGSAGESLLARLTGERGARLWVVHRLDREASGLVLFAKDAEIHRALCAEFEARRVRKVYLALVLGRLEGGGLIEAPLRECGSGRVGVSPRGKACSTRWNVERALPSSTLLRVEPLTGRKHQIRAHLASLGHPIMGDPRYGPAPRPVGGVRRLMLHALGLSVEAGRAYELAVEPPEDFQTVVDGS